MTQMKPCPFCGDEPTYRERRDEDLATHNIVTWRRVHCLTCDAGQESPDGYEGGTAIERWNRRAGEDAILQDLREEVAHAMSETTPSWGHRLHRLLAILGLNFGPPEDVNRLIMADAHRTIRWHPEALRAANEDRDWPPPRWKEEPNA